MAGAAQGPALEALLEREQLKNAVVARRAGVPRAHKEPSLATRAFLEGLMSPFLGTAGSATFVRILASKSGQTWDRYIGAIRPWFEHASSHELGALPPDPVHFLAWLEAMGSSDSGYSQTKVRCVAMNTMCSLAGVQSPASHPLVKAYREGARRSRGHFRRGRVTAVLCSQLPPPLPPLSPTRAPPTARRGGRAGPSPRTHRRLLNAAARHAALMHCGALRYDDTREGQLGDILFFDDVVDINVFGSKTDKGRIGQTSQMPISILGPDGGPSGSQALVDSICGSLRRLVALPPQTLERLGARLQASHPKDQAGPEALSTWPADLQALARQLYAHGLRAHLLPYYGPWMWEAIDADFDLSRTCSTAQFQRVLQRAFRAHGRPIHRLGSHSLRRGRAAELFHGGIAPAALTRVLRHLSPQSSLPYVLESARASAAAAAMRDASHRSAAISRAAKGRRITP